MFYTFYTGATGKGSAPATREMNLKQLLTGNDNGQ
jgi:hypothetical protein